MALPFLTAALSLVLKLSHSWTLAASCSPPPAPDSWPPTVSACTSWAMPLIAAPAPAPGGEGASLQAPVVQELIRGTNCRKDWRLPVAHKRHQTGFVAATQVQATAPAAPHRACPRHTHCMADLSSAGRSRTCSVTLAARSLHGKGRPQRLRMQHSSQQHHHVNRG